MLRFSTYKCLLFSLILCLCGVASQAQTPGPKAKTLLIINSYGESAPWIRPLIAPITLYVANDNNVHAELFNLNNILITDSVSYNTVKNNLFATYEQHHPDYVVAIGILAFTFREEIKAKWGDIPMLLISRDMTLAPLDYYFSGFDKPLVDQHFPSIADLRPEYNFTAIYVPDFYRETIDLMHSLLPGMKQLVFFSDGVFLNRYRANDIELYLYEEYPEIEFKWVQASEDRPDELQSYFVNRMPDTGMLMSSWYYSKTGPFGYPTFGFGDLNLIYSSVNPIFSLRESYMSMGSIGGVYPNQERIHEQIIELLDEMVHGASMRDLKFYTNRKDSYTKISFPLLEEFHLSVHDCPRGTIFVDKPLSFWSKYKWQMIATISFLALLIFLFLRHIQSQRQEIKLLSRHKKFVSSMPVPYSKAKVIYDEMGNVVNIKYNISNEAFDRLIHENADPDTMMLFPAEFIAEKTSKMLETNSIMSFMHHFDKTDRYYLFTLCLVDDERDKKNRERVNDVDIFALDVTKRQKTELQLKQTTKKLDQTLNVARLIPWDWNLETDDLTFDSQSMFNRMGLTFDGENKPIANEYRMAGFDFINMIHPDDRHILVRLREQLLTGRISEFHEEYRMIVARKGQNVEEWIEVYGAVTERRRDGKPLFVTGSFLVITDRKREQLELIEAKERANQSDKMKSAFLANMSHEIRTPLNAIVGFSGLICEAEDADKRREFARIISKNNDALLSLVSDILDLAQIESNTLDISVSDVDINGLLNAIYETIETRLQDGVKLNMVVGAPKCIVRTDGNRLSQILINLLSNACKFTSKGSITFGYDMVDDNELYFYVKDTGLGISAENQKRLFERFDKLDNFTQGTGLGLSISKSLTELLGGSIGMKSRGEGKGSTFWFTIKYEPIADDTVESPSLPVEVADNLDELHATLHMAMTKQVPPTADASEDVVTTKAEAESQLPAAPPLSPKVILAAEDIEGNFLLLKHFMPPEYTLLHAWNGREAVDMYLQYHPDMILMDINMPELNGYEATAEIRALDKNIPIVAVTAYAYASDRKRILQSGFNDYVSKPLTRNDLLNALHRCLTTPPSILNIRKSDG